MLLVWSMPYALYSTILRIHGCKIYNTQYHVLQIRILTQLGEAGGENLQIIKILSVFCL